MKRHYKAKEQRPTKYTKFTDASKIKMFSNSYEPFFKHSVASKVKKRSRAAAGHLVLRSKRVWGEAATSILCGSGVK